MNKRAILTVRIALYILYGLFVPLGIVGSFEKIINGNVKIVGKRDEGFVISFVLLGFITAYTILIHIQIHCQF